MTKVKELQYPDECATCKADAIDKYHNQFKRTIIKYIIFFADLVVFVFTTIILFALILTQGL